MPMGIAIGALSVRDKPLLPEQSGKEPDVSRSKYTTSFITLQRFLISFQALQLLC